MPLNAVSSAMTQTRRPTPVRWILLAGGSVLLAVLALVWWLAVRPAEGEAAPSVLPTQTRMGVVDIDVRDLDAVAAYYTEAVGLDVIEETPDGILLGRGEPLLQLVRTDAPADTPTSAGLYHSAILYPDEASLAATLARIAEQAPMSYQGAADHAVSVAFYFGDPEGNGLELYVDRPREEWVWQDGEVQMGSAFVDVNAFIQEHIGGEAGETATLGHVHLRVGDLDQARAFYADTLGFDVTAVADGALFYSAGGYHHHLATNTWQSSGAGARPDSAGLGALTVVLPDAGPLAEIAERVEAAGADALVSDEGLVTADPWGNTIRFVVG